MPIGSFIDVLIQHRKSKVYATCYDHTWPILPWSDKTIGSGCHIRVQSAYFETPNSGFRSANNLSGPGHQLWSCGISHAMSNSKIVKYWF